MIWGVPAWFVVLIFLMFAVPLVVGVVIGVRSMRAPGPDRSVDRPT